MDNVVAQIVIEMDRAGQVEVNANGAVMSNRVLAGGLLDVARDTIKEMQVKAAAQIQPATAAERLALNLREGLKP